MQRQEQTLSIGTHRVHTLVVQPSVPTRVGRERLDAIRLQRNQSLLDLQLLEMVQASRTAPQMVIFRGRSGSSGSWTLDASLEDPELDELVRGVCEAQLATHRQILELGVWAILHTELRVRELAAFRAGTRALVRRLEASHTSALDLAIARDHVVYLGMSLERTLQGFIPDTYSTFETRRGALTPRFATHPIVDRRATGP